MTGAEAVRKLADMAGVELPERGPVDPAEDAAARERSTMLHAVHAAQEFFQAALMAPEGERARAYLAERGIGLELAQRYGIGFGGDGRGLMAELARRHVPPEVAEAVGLVLPSHHGDGFYERFRGRLVFPVFNLDGAPTAFSARRLPPDEDGPKYVNSPESPIYTKGAAVFGLVQARQAIRRMRSAVLVEGNFDVLAMAAAGVEHVVAPLGTALTSQQLRTLRRFAEHVVLCFDGDEAGRKASRRAVALLIEAGIEGDVVVLADGEDPDSLLRAGGADAVQAAIDRARPMVTYLIEAMIHDHGRTPHALRKIVEEAREVFATERDAFRYGRYREELARLLQVDVREIRQLLRDPAGANRDTAGSGVTSEVPAAERTLLELLLCDDSLIDRFLAEDPDGELLASPEAREVLAQIVAAARAEDDISPCDAIVLTADDTTGSLRSRLAKAMHTDNLHPEPVEEFSQVLDRLRRDELARRQQAVLERLVQAQSEGRQEEAARLAVEAAAMKRRMLSIA
jgi:DNA primase